MKALAILMKAILLIFTINAIGQETHYDWVKLNLDGQVKSININEFIASEESGNIIKNGKQKAFGGDLWLFFNKEGKIDSLFNFSSEGILFTKYVYVYDIKSLLSEINKFDKDQGLYRKHIFKYNSKNELIEEQLFNNPKGVPTDKYLFFYNEKGLLTEKHHIYYPCIDTSRKELLKTTYEYDIQGNMIKKQLFKKDSTKDFGYSYQYNNNEKLIEQIAFLSSGNMNYKETYQYDERGNRIEICKYNQKNEIEFTQNFQYKFDEIGNWVEMLIFINTNPKFVVERTIKYF
jgi:hypothetical protein